MEHLIQEHGKLIASLADKLCRRYDCPRLRDDLISAANLALLQKAGDYDTSAGASMATYLYPYLVGAMRRELERSLYSVSLPKDVFGALRRTDFASLEECAEEKSPTALPVEWQVLRKIYIDCVKDEFDQLSFKERQILGGFFGVFEHPKQTLADLAEEFQMTENALLKAKDKMLGKLRLACESGQFGRWRVVQQMIQAAQRECVSTDTSTPQTPWYLEKQREG